MWATISRHWDDLALAFLVGFYLTAGIAAIVSLVSILRATL
jgi:hypothetical protein